VASNAAMPDAAMIDVVTTTTTVIDVAMVAVPKTFNVVVATVIRGCVLMGVRVGPHHLH
jgi:hypothetical protein